MRPMSHSPSSPTRTLHTLSRMCLFVENGVWGWSVVPAPECQLSSHSWRCTFKKCKQLFNWYPNLSQMFLKKIRLALVKKYLPVKSEKDEVSLVVEGGHLSSNELRFLWEKSGQQAADAVSQTGGEIVEYHLWVVFGWIFASSLWDKNGARCWCQITKLRERMPFRFRVEWGRK